MKTLRKLFSYYLPYLGIMITYLIIGAVIVSLAMLLPQITKYIISSVIGDTPFSVLGITPKSKDQLFIILAIAWIGIIVLRQALSYFRTLMMTKSSIKAVCKMREDVFDNMLWQSQSFLHKENTGNILTIVNGDTEIIKGFFTGTVPTIIEAFFGFVFASIMIGRMSPAMVLTTYVFTVPLYIFSSKFSKVFSKHYRFVRESSADLSMVTQENINGIRIVKAYAQEEQEKKKFSEKNEAFCKYAIDYMVVWGKRYIPFGIICYLPNICITIMSALLVINGNLDNAFGLNTSMTLAEFVAIAGYTGYILSPFQQASNWLSQAQQAAISAEKVFNFLNHGTSISSKKNAVKPDISKVDIKAEHVSFSISKKVILDDVSFELPQGKSLGVVGVTGSGKTMLTNMLLRFYDPTSGSISVNGHDLRDIDLSVARSCFAPVLQDVFLFSDTIAKNIAFGHPDATFEDVIECAKIAQADEFIKKMPDEYNTIVGERGMGLSGGQKQRISIARALMYDSPVLIFDDATSALDMETEEELYRQLNEQKSEKSKVIIAHRISSVKDCDEIIVLNKGKIIERGTHDELVAMKGHYYDIYKEQYSTVLQSL